MNDPISDGRTEALRGMTGPDDTGSDNDVDGFSLTDIADALTQYAAETAESNPECSADLTKAVELIAKHATPMAPEEEAEETLAPPPGGFDEN